MASVNGRPGVPGGPAQATEVALQGPCGVSFAPGVLYVGAGVVRAVSIGTGKLTTPAGNAAPGSLRDGAAAMTVALNACGVTVDQQGNLVMAANAAQVAVVAASTGTFTAGDDGGDIYTVAGTGTAGFSGDGGPAVGAELDLPAGGVGGRCGQRGDR
jgi:trimeric autotransporter adhesin